MVISPETVAALQAVGLAALIAIAAIIRFLPNYMQKRIDLSLEAQSTRIKEESNEKTADIEERRAISALLLAMSGNLKALTDAFVNQQAAHTAQSGEIKALTSITEQNHELTQKFSQLLDTGSRPLQELHGKIDALRVEVIGTIGSRDEDKARLEKVITEATEAIISSTLIVKLAKEKLEDAKRSTGQNPQIDLTVVNGGQP